MTHVERDLAGRIVALVSPTGLRTSYSYDACGRMVDVTDPAGRVTRYSYTSDFPGGDSNLSNWRDRALRV